MNTKVSIWKALTLVSVLLLSLAANAAPSKEAGSSEKLVGKNIANLKQ